MTQRVTRAQYTVAASVNSSLQTSGKNMQFIYKVSIIKWSFVKRIHCL